jgi:hypothetical protein
MTGSRVKPVSVLEAILNGASDYVRKPLGKAEISAFSQAAIRMMKAARKETHDPSFFPDRDRAGVEVWTKEFKR